MKITKEREYLFDNLKGLLIIFVVFGHLIEDFSLRDVDGLAGTVYGLIYVFHMPLFVFISGYFSKNNNLKRITELIFIYIFCQSIIYPLGLSLLTGTTYLDNLQSVFLPEFTYWYMLSLVTWRVITPYITTIKHNLFLSFILGALFGLSLTKVDLSYMSIGRSISFYPFFLMGYKTHSDKIQQTRAKLGKNKGFLVMISICVIALLLFEVLPVFTTKPTKVFKILYSKDHFDEYFTNPYIGVVFKAVLYALQLTFIRASIALVSNKKTILYRLSTASLLIYVTHGMLIRYYEKMIYPQLEVRSELKFLLIAFVLSTLYCFLLSVKPIKRIGNYILQLPAKIMISD